MIRALFLGSAALLLAGCKASPKLPDAPQVDLTQTLRIFETLSADDMQGRLPETEGHEKARSFLTEEMLESGFFDTIGEKPFTAVQRNRDGETVREFTGRNLIAVIDMDPNDTKPVLVVTAHYDHIGVRNGEIYNGADDNASGSAALFAIAQSFRSAPPDHDIIFAWLDVEESGLQGAYALVADDMFKGRPAVNLNLDMISQNESEIYLSGTYHYPKLGELLKHTASGTGINVKYGHDRPEDGGQDWTLASDHAAFHTVGIPFVYFGVEDHDHYHKPTDDFEIVPLDFYKGSVQTIVNAAHIIEDNLPDLAKARKEETP